MPRPGDPIIDGVRVGTTVPCDECEHAPDAGEPWSLGGDSVAKLARDAIGVRWPELGSDYVVTYHREGCPPSPEGHQCLVTRSGTLWVVLAQWGDATSHAVAIYCGVGGCRHMKDYRTPF